MSLILETIRNLIKKEIKDQVIRCKVLSVDQTACTVDVKPIDDRAEMFDVQLKAINDGTDTGVIIFPKVGSYVYVGLVQNNVNSAYVAVVTEFDRILISRQAPSFSLEITSAGDLVINQGVLGGMVKVNDLLGKINALESDLNTLKTAFTAWVVAPGDGGAALKLIATTWAAAPITPTTISEIENPKVKH